MTNRVSRLPGMGCRYFRAGRCLYEESRNPGLEPGYRCQVIERLGQAFDDFVQRAELLSLSEQQASRLWEARFPVTLAKEGNCQDYLPGDTDSFPNCRHADGDLCVLAFPVCDGRCARYTRP